jgi:hypothetical protein
MACYFADMNAFCATLELESLKAENEVGGHHRPPDRDVENGRFSALDSEHIHAMRIYCCFAATFAGALITCRSSYFLLLRPLDRAFTREAVNLFVKEIIGKAWEGKRGRQQIDWQETAAGFAHDSCELLSQLGGATYFPSVGIRPS